MTATPAPTSPTEPTATGSATAARSGAAADRAGFVRGIEDRYLALLRDADSPLLGSDTITGQLRAQLASILDALAPELRWPTETTAPAAGDAAGAGARDPFAASVAIGAARAASEVNPAQSLTAASLIFQAALPAVADRLAALGHPSPDRTAALLLNRAILDRMAIAAVSYIEVLLTKAQAANHDERRRVSRDLHDIAAPAVAVALQGLELYEVYATADPAHASLKFAAAQRSMRDVLRVVRELASDLREDAGSLGLAAALRRFLDSIEPSVSIDLTVDPATHALSTAYAAEVFLLLSEAVRNALSHARPTAITITVTTSPGPGTGAIAVLRACVTDDGTGFSVEDTLRNARHVGLDSMRERAELLGGTLTLHSIPGNGTTVTLTVPYPTHTAKQASP